MANVDWKKTYWKRFNISKTMHTLEKNSNFKYVRIFQVIKKINYVLFQLSENYKRWNIKLIYNQNNLLTIKKNLYI